MEAPGEPSYSDPQGSWLRRLRRFAMANRLRSGRGYRVKRTPGGTSLEIEPPRVPAITDWFPFRIHNVPSPDPNTYQDWQCWQVHGGYVGYRSRHVVETEFVFGNDETYISPEGWRGVGTDGKVGVFGKEGFDF